MGGWPAPEEACLGNRVRPDARPQDSAAPSAGPRPLSTPGRPARQPPANTPPPGPTHTTCGEPRLAGGLLHGHGERGGRRGGLRPGQRPVAAEGHGDASGLHGGLVVPQLVDALLLQQESLLRGDGGGHVRQRASLPPQAVRPSHARPPAALLPTRPAGAGWGAPHRGMQTPPRLPPSPRPGPLLLPPSSEDRKGCWCTDVRSGSRGPGPGRPGKGLEGVHAPLRTWGPTQATPGPRGGIFQQKSPAQKGLNQTHTSVKKSLQKSRFSLRSWLL